jgi:hypothetical protein
MKCQFLLLGALALSFGAAADGLRDPTRPPLVASRPATPREAAPVLSAVLTYNGVRSAIFNGQLVHGGMTVGAYAIEEVLEDGVRFRHAGLVQELRLPRPDSTFKKPAIDGERPLSGAQ